MSLVLIIDDDELTRETFASIVALEGFRVETAANIDTGLKRVRVGDVDVVMLDVRLPDGDGLALIPTIREAPRNPEVIIITGYGDADGAELAIKNGAWDYIEKGSSKNRILLSLTRALNYREGKQSSRAAVALKREGIVGSSPRMEVCFDQLAQAASSQANVLITGETGTGKELFAWAVHANSPRANQSYIIVDCAALPETLTESVLFGHEKGAYTGADVARVGLLKQADQGTLFLDELGELPFSIQKAFLRAVDTRRFRSIGGTREITSDFRLVAATNRNLNQMVEGGLFRAELLFRLRALVIDLPPLRDRLDDLKDLVLFHLGEICGRHGRAVKGFSPDFLEILAAYPWPGNIRELVHTLEMAHASAGEEPMLTSWHLPTSIRIHALRATVGRGQNSLEVGDQGRTGPNRPEGLSGPTKPLRWNEFKELNERRYLEELLSRTAGDVKAASRASGLSSARMYELLRKHGLNRLR